MQYGVIMAGGAGTRLWPISRADKPKQLINVVRGKSLLQLSYERLRGMLPPQRIFVCTGAVHRDLVLDNIPELPKENLLGEPEGRPRVKLTRLEDLLERAGTETAGAGTAPRRSR